MSETSCRIVDWLSSCSAANQEDDSPLPSASQAALISLPRTKRKAQAMADDTPRAKRPALGIATPSNTNSIADDVRIPIFGHKTPSLKSSNASSRSSSPTKRKREAEMKFSRPSLWFYTRSESKDWKTKYTADVPLLKELLEGLHSNAYEQRVTTKIRHTYRKILGEIEKCQQRSSSEEQWSDSVVLRAMRTARKLAMKQAGAEIINVKTIQVWPSHLLPTNEQSSKANTKRVDYTFGLKIGDRDEVHNILELAQDHTLVQTDAWDLRDLALCSHVEIKTRRSQDDARYQLSVWCAAGFQKQENLWLQQFPDTDAPPTPCLAPIPIWLWCETNVTLWIVVMDSPGAKLHVLDEKTFSIDVDEEASLSRVIGAMAATIDWGQTHYLPWFRALIGCPDTGQQNPGQG